MHNKITSPFERLVILLSTYAIKQITSSLEAIHHDPLLSSNDCNYLFFFSYFSQIDPNPKKLQEKYILKFDEERC